MIGVLNCFLPELHYIPAVVVTLSVTIFGFWFTGGHRFEGPMIDWEMLKSVLNTWSVLIGCVYGFFCFTPLIHVDRAGDCTSSGCAEVSGVALRSVAVAAKKLPRLMLTTKILSKWGYF